MPCTWIRQVWGPGGVEGAEDYAEIKKGRDIVLRSLNLQADPSLYSSGLGLSTERQCLHLRPLVK